MYKIELFKRLDDGNRGEKLSHAMYPTKELADIARRAFLWLNFNRNKIAKDWKWQFSIIVSDPVKC